MKYSDINNNKDHILNLIKWLYQEVVSSGGDGDAIWYSKYYDIKDIFPIIKEFNDAQKFKWKDLELDEDCILWHDNQESILITNDIKYFDNRPVWSQCSLVW